MDDGKPKDWESIDDGWEDADVEATDAGSADAVAEEAEPAFQVDDTVAYAEGGVPEDVADFLSDTAPQPSTQPVDSSANDRDTVPRIPALAEIHGYIEEELVTVQSPSPAPEDDEDQQATVPRIGALTEGIVDDDHPPPVESTRGTQPMSLVLLVLVLLAVGSLGFLVYAVYFS